MRTQVIFKLWAGIFSFTASLLFLLFQGGRASVLLFMVVSCLTLYLLLGRWSGISSVSGDRRVSKDGAEPLEAGSSLEVSLHLQVPGIWPVPYIIVSDRLLGKGGKELQFTASAALDWKRGCTIHYTSPPLSRGTYSFKSTQCSTEDIFGLFKHTGELLLPTTFQVQPQVVHIDEWNRFTRTVKGRFHHSASVQALKETTQINGVREYLHGDRMSRIHWNATAKTGTWKSKEFERESLPKTIIVLDCERTAYDQPEQFELAVSIAASIIAYGKRNQMSIGILTTGRVQASFEPEPTAASYTRLMQHLIDVQPDGEHPLKVVLLDRVRSLPSGAFCVLISPRSGNGLLHAMNVLEQRQMTLCQIAVGSEAEELSNTISNWVALLKSKGYMGYRIRQLQELAVQLRGQVQ